MFEHDRATTAVERLTTIGRGQLATLCLLRMSGLVTDARIEREYPAIPRLVEQIRQHSVACAQQLPSDIDPEDLDRNLRDFLGSDEYPQEELPGWGSWVMDVSSLADYVLRTWRNPDSSATNAFQVLLAAYSIAGFLESESNSPGVPDLAETEFQRQMLDAAEIADGRMWGELVRSSINLEQVYAGWIEHVTA
ncbi:hypothetical protein ACIRQF_07280 [Streptomyces sp. NPDC101191]|uniref:hypothetical protein n=1 Tax=Streptomyces sp. NPDC101191 TaxID=3366126 RepID=UPI00380EA317